MAISEKEKIIVFIKDSLCFLLLFVIYSSFFIDNLAKLFLVYISNFLLLLSLVYNFKNNSLNFKKIKLNPKSKIFGYSFSTSITFIVIYILGIYKFRLILENGIYFIVLDIFMIFIYFLFFNWER